jgi:hypothetical protein
LTCDTDEQVINKLEKFMKDNFSFLKRQEEIHDEDSKPFHKLPLEFLNGWITF